MKSVLTIVLVTVASLALHAQDDTDVVPVPIIDLPADSRVIAFATVEGRTTEVLVTEIETADGTTAFYLFDYIDDTLRARLVGPRLIPGDLAAPATHQPETMRVDAPGDRFWRVAGSPTDTDTDHLVGAPSLAELRFIEVDSSPWQLSPAPSSPLAIEHLSLAADGSVSSSCVLEPNITAAVDRMTTFGAWWVHPFGEPHLLVGMLHSGPGQDRRGGLRLYNAAYELVAATSPSLEVDANAIPDLVRADLSGDGEDELIFFSTAQHSRMPVAVHRFVRRANDRRVLSFNLCSVRMNGPDVVLLQRALAGRGFSLGPHGIDGWYGPDTRAAVIRFQREAELPVTGIVEPELWRLLGL